MVLLLQNLLVAMTFTLNFSENIDSIIISQSSAHLVIVHAQMVLLNAPESGQTSRINNLEHACLLVLPLDVGSVSLSGVVQELLQEVPEQSSVGGG